ncbi:DUF6233 domain-containing protein [Streptomyces roseus]|uniref:DUF6233 domain-containing protein n=1 Tax=Streptomyces roseus TaxID=66430 RepID=UPI0033C9EBCB
MIQAAAVFRALVQGATRRPTVSPSSSVGSARTAASSQAPQTVSAKTRRQPPPEPAAWQVERGVGVGRLPDSVRTSECWKSGERCAPLSAGRVRRLPTDGTPSRIHCRPDGRTGPDRPDAHTAPGLLRTGGVLLLGHSGRCGARETLERLTRRG